MAKKQKAAEPDKLPPQDLGAEQCALGSFLVDPGASGFLGRVVEEHFYREAHRIIVRALRSLHKRGDAIDLVTLAGELGRVGQLEAVGGGEYLTALIGEVPTSAHLPEYIGILERKRRSRELIALGLRLQEAGYNDADDPSATALAFQDDLGEIALPIGGQAAPIDTVTSSVMMESAVEVKWLWRDWVPQGHLTILAGETGCGKSGIGLALASCLATGAPWPDGTEHDFNNAMVLIADTEGAQTVFLDRIRRWGLPAECFLFPGTDGYGRLLLDDLEVVQSVRALIDEKAVPLVIVDSLRTGLGSAIDENDARIGNVLAPWQELCRQTGIGLIIVHHYGKRGRHKTLDTSLDRIRGSTAIAAAGRSIIAIDKPDGGSAYSRLQVVKSNLALLPEPVGFRMTGEGIEFTGEAPTRPREDTAIAKADEFLREALQQSPRHRSDLVADAAGQGLSEDSLYRAYKALGIVSVRDAQDPTGRRRLWSLPPKPGQDDLGL